MNRRSSTHYCVLLAAACCVHPSCDASSLSSALSFLGSGVTIEIQNDTAFTAVPQLHTSGSRNLIEDVFEESETLDDLGAIGRVASNNTARLTLTCDDGLETISFGGAVFRTATNIPVGDADVDERLRRDSDFDCGDVIRIRLSGDILNFKVDITVDQGNTGGNLDLNTNSDPVTTDGENDVAEIEDDIADVLDDLFGT